MSRVIFHVDVNSAFLSWSAAYRVRVLGEREDLRDIPSAVAGERAERHGIITRFRDCLSLILRGLRGIFFRALPLVEVNGHKCRVVGQIGMLHIAVDVRGIECKPGDRVIVPINPLHVKGMKIQYR